MRTMTHVSLLGAAALMAVAGCTVKDVDQPALAGPSTMAHSITMVADRDTLTQNGSDFTDIRITALGPDGQSENIPLSAQIYVDGVPGDFGTLSSKTPITPATIRYTAPAASTIAAAQVATTVTIAVTPRNAGDFRGEMIRQIDIQLLPQGIILPVNPNLVANFTVTPTAPQIGQTTTFDASTSTNNGVACALACTYLWNFGDGTGGQGITTTHQFRAVGNFPVTLTVSDARGASTSKTITVVVAAPTPPTGTIVLSPTPPVGTNTEVFFNASNVQWAGRTIASYSWNFGDGTSATGVTTTHRYSGVGTYTVVLTVTDTGNAQGQLTVSVTVNAQGGAAAALTVTPTSPKVGQAASFDASASTPSTGASIVSYKFNYGDGTEEVTSNPVQSHTYGSAGTVNASVEITDTNGKTSTKVVNLTITP